MCTICGGTRLELKELTVFHLSEDRGRDYSNLFYRHGSWICNHRAIPTTEKKNPEHNQPFGTDYKIVHNGVISNDKELGNTTGEIDSSVLANVLDCTNIYTLMEISIWRVTINQFFMLLIEVILYSLVMVSI